MLLTTMHAVTICLLLYAICFVSTTTGVSRNDAEILQIFPGDKIRALEGMRLVVNCTSYAHASTRQMVWNASRGNDHMNSVILSNSTVALIFGKLHRSDAGFYTCYLFLSKGKTYFKTIHISVSSGFTIGYVNRCAPTQFRCGTGSCIFLQYRCDNKDDCGDNSDEEECGDNPCGNKFMCDNKRCISHDLVCDKFHNDDCDDLSDERCTFDETKLPDTLPGQSAATSHPRQTSVDDQMRWLKTTVYSVIGCTVGVVLFIAALVIAIFRIKMKRAAARRQMTDIERRRREHSIGHRSYRFAEADPSRSRLPPYCRNNIILNINNGVQYVPGLEFTSLVEAPPPYSDSGGEAAPARTDSPPPPYSTIDRRHTEAVCRGDNSSPVSNAQSDDPLLAAPDQTGRNRNNTVMSAQSQAGVAPGARASHDLASSSSSLRNP